MNTQPTSPAREEANILFTTLILAAILGITLAGYLLWVQSQNVNVAESQAWNSALALAEAGIEEGMAQVNVVNGGVNPTNYYDSIRTNFGSLAAGVYGPKSNSLIGGSYSVIVIPGNPGPTIIATGYSSVAYVGVPISRVVRVTTTTASLFGNGITALVDVDTKGNNVTIDSYDSSDSSHSTNGMYDAATRMAGGDVASVTGPVNIQGSDIFGHLRVGPNASYAIGNGQVGDLPKNWPAQSGIEQGWLYTDFNSTFPDVLPPYGSGSGLPSVKNGAINLGSQQYYVSGDLVTKNGDTFVVDGANAVLYVTGGVNMNSGSTIIVTNGGTLKVYAGVSTGVSKVSTVLYNINTTGNASTFQFYGLPSTTSVTWGGNNQYVGTVYAPEAVFTLGGGGNNTMDYQGACVVSSAKLNGKFNLHFDQYLKRAGPSSGYTVASWTEL